MQSSRSWSHRSGAIGREQWRGSPISYLMQKVCVLRNRTTRAVSTWGTEPVFARGLSEPMGEDATVRKGGSEHGGTAQRDFSGLNTQDAFASNFKPRRVLC